MSNNVENVFILGAGASFDYDAPLMSNFIDKAEDLMYSNSFEDREKVARIFNLITDLQRVHAKSYMDLDNIETLFGFLEMGLVIKKLGKYKEDEIKELKDSLVYVIVNTLFKSIDLIKVRENTGYKLLANYLKEIKTESAIITFNYDVALDYELIQKNIPFDYCLNDTAMESNKKKYCKLHGSLNWYTSENEEIRPTKFDENRKNEVMPLGGSAKRRIISYLPPDNKLPVIIPPTWNKSTYHGQIANVWHHAANALSTAKNIYIIGYSLPESDAFFKYLFSLGTLGESRIRRLWVFNPDEKVEANYNKMVGKGIENRFEFHDKGFDEAMKYISNKDDIKPKTTLSVI